MKTLRTVLLDFEKLSKTKFQLPDITEEFVNRFKGYLLTKRNLNNNTAHKRMKLLKAFLNYCEEKRYFRLDLNFSKIKMKGYDPTVISLTEPEYCNLRDWDAGKYEKVKAVFIFGCLTSLKFSDIKNLRRDDIVNDQICIRSAKTNVQHFIPLTLTAKAILEKYNYTLDFFTNQTYNRLLKKMAQASGFFDTQVTVVIQRGNQQMAVQKPKWACFGSHFARRVNITRNITKNLPLLNVVMDIAGLKRMDTVLKYMDKFGPINDYSKILED
ncbi:MAG: phage integrase SAM-like domain-containing protein [bacterium]